MLLDTIFATIDPQVSSFSEDFVCLSIEDGTVYVVKTFGTETVKRKARPQPQQHALAL